MEKQEFDISWKIENPTYLLELQKFLDKAENIKEQDLKKEIIYQMLRCDDILTKLSCERFEYYYQKGLSNKQDV